MDDGSPIGYLVLILICICGSAYFAASETALASVSRIRIMSLSENGDRRARRVLYLLDHFDKTLTTILIGNNLLHIGCASITTLLATKLWGVSAVTATTIVTTMTLFLLAEMLPKRFAKACNERMALLVSWSLLGLFKLLSPVSAVFSALANRVGRPFRHAEEEPTVTEDELLDLIETAATEGALDEEKTELVQNAFDFSETVARDIFTPWQNVVYVGVAMPEERIVETIRSNVHSRLPVVDVHGEVIGVLQIRKYLKAYLRGSAPLLKVMDEPRFVDADRPIDELLASMSAQKTQLAIVRDASGATIGIVSVEDILEELVGEIYDEDDLPSPETTAVRPAGVCL